jgi:hypothetical protein
VPLGVVGDVFEVMAQVDRPLTKVNAVDRIIRVINPTENLGRHNEELRVRKGNTCSTKMTCCEVYMRWEVML